MYLIIFITTSILNILGFILKLKCRRIDLLSQNIKKRLVLNQLRPKKTKASLRVAKDWSFVVFCGPVQSFFLVWDKFGPDFQTLNEGILVYSVAILLMLGLFPVILNHKFCSSFQLVRESLK